MGLTLKAKLHKVQQILKFQLKSLFSLHVYTINKRLYKQNVIYFKGKYLVHYNQKKWNSKGHNRKHSKLYLNK